MMDLQLILFLKRYLPYSVLTKVLHWGWTRPPHVRIPPLSSHIECRGYLAAVITNASFALHVYWVDAYPDAQVHNESIIGYLDSMGTAKLGEYTCNAHTSSISGHLDFPLSRVSCIGVSDAASVPSTPAQMSYMEGRPMLNLSPRYKTG